MEGLKTYELDALWLMRREGEDWGFEPESDREPYPVFQSDSVDYIQGEILSRANDWSNEWIRRYLESRYVN